MYHFFNNAFGYVSYDGADAQMITINNDPNINCPNAQWTGSVTRYCTGTATDDIIAHEWGHAYTQYTNNLVYAWQSGAMNESYSDIWGETIDLLNGYEDDGENLSLRTGCGSSDRWMQGEDASGFGGAIRDMWDPTCKGDPGKVTDGQYWCRTTDGGGVHTNSGIPNHAYALLVDGYFIYFIWWFSYSFRGFWCGSIVLFGFCCFHIQNVGHKKDLGDFKIKYERKYDDYDDNWSICFI